MDRDGISVFGVFMTRSLRAVIRCSARRGQRARLA